MNIYKSLNEMTKYIDDNLENKIEYNILAKILGVNVYTMQRLFTMLSGIPLAEYIRKRRLSRAGYDLYNNQYKVIDIAIKYQYESATAFSRAFEKFHNIKPSNVNKETKLKNFPRIVFEEIINDTNELSYEIIELDELNLYGTYVLTNNDTISHDAPKFFETTENKYIKKFGLVKYGMITYDNERIQCQRYYCLYEKEIEGFEKIKIPSTKWLRFRIDSQNPKDIQEISHRFYKQFLPSVKYNLKELPELEYYHDNVTDFLIPIY